LIERERVREGERERVREREFLRGVQEEEGDREVETTEGGQQRL
jgi:hypothetical protein